MHETIQKMARAFAKERTQRRRAYAGFTALAILVSVTTTYMLVQPANTMAVERTYVCGMEEHVHTDACYEWICDGTDDAEDTDREAPGDDNAAVTQPEDGAAPEATPEEPETPAAEEPKAEAPAAQPEEPEAEESTPVTPAESEEAKAEETKAEETKAEAPAAQPEEPKAEEPAPETPAEPETPKSEEPASEESAAPAEGENLTASLIHNDPAPADVPASEESAAPAEPEAPKAEEPKAEEPAPETPAKPEEPKSEEPAAPAEDGNVPENDADTPHENTSSSGHSGHVHTSACRRGALICGKEEHVHTNACLESVVVLPEGTEIPDGYDNRFVAQGDGYTVAVYAPDGALPEGAELVVALLDEDSEGYADAAVTLTAAAAQETELYVDGAPSELAFAYDGFVALDIHFELDGEEIEPTAPVMVYLDVQGLLPEDADPDSVQVQHHATYFEAQPVTLDLEAEEDTEPAEPVELVALELVADGTEEIGALETSEGDDGLNVTTLFTVESFSKFTVTYSLENFEGTSFKITWEPGEKQYNMKDQHVANIYYVGLYENKIIPLQYGGTVKNYSIGPSGNLDINGTFEQFLTGDVKPANNSIKNVSITYSGAYIGDITSASQRFYLGGKDCDISFNWREEEFGNGGWYYTPDNTVAANNWVRIDKEYTSGEYWTTSVNVYLLYNVIGVVDNSVHDDINVTLYDYGSQVNDASKGAILDFFAEAGLEDNNKFTQVDGNATNDNNHHRRADLYPYLDKATQTPNIRTFEHDSGTPYTSSEKVYTTGNLSKLFGTSVPKASYQYPTEYTYDSAKGNYTDFFSKRYEMKGDGGLFQYDSKTGYYEYDSAKNAAWFNGSGFELYDAAIAPGFTTNKTVSATENSNVWSNFFPFNKPTFNNNTPDTTTRYDGKTVYFTGYNATGYNPETTNNWFGMTMDIDFMMPYNNGVAGVLENGDDMIFEFSGDDDVWVYIDDVLVLDIGGTHGAKSASVNFKTGKAYFPDCREGSTKEHSLWDLYAAAYQEDGQGYTTLDAFMTAHGFDLTTKTFGKYTTHSMKFFYMERGGNISYCKLKFNMPPLPKNSITVKKEVSGNVSGMELNDSYTFQLLNKKGDTITSYGENDGIFYLKADEEKSFEGITVDSGSFMVRELFTEEEKAQYDSVTINGYLKGFEKLEQPVTVGKTVYTYACSTQWNSIDDKPLTFIVDNHLTSGGLRITKLVNRTDGVDDTSGTFQFRITLPKALAGTYPVTYSSDLSAGTTTGEVVFTAVDDKAVGEITLCHGQTATITEIPAFSGTLTAEEINSDGYAVKWTHGDNTQWSTSASVTDGLAPGGTIALICTNTTGAQLPSTGGMGTNVFTGLGITMMLGAGVLLMTQRRRREASFRS